MQMFKTFAVQMILLTAFCQVVYAGDPTVQKAALYNNEEFKEEQGSFSPFDPFYFVLDLSNLEPGEYFFTTDWISPAGKVVRQTSYTFTLDRFTPGYQVYSWVRLLEKGSLTSSFSGDSFNREVYGDWTVKAYLNGVQVAEKQFDVY